MSDPTYYKVNSTRITFREYNWGTPFPISGLVWMTKWLGIRLPASTDDPMVHEVGGFEVARLPEEIEETFGELWDELERLGFCARLFHHFAIPHCSTHIYWASFLDESGKTLARLHYRVWRATRPPQTYLFPMFLTELSDGGFLWSSSGKPDMLAPDEITMNRRRGATVEELWESHRELLHEQSASEIVPVRDDYGLRELTDRHHALVRDFHIRRGVFEPLVVADWLKRPEPQSPRSRFSPDPEWRLPEAGSSSLHDPASGVRHSAGDHSSAELVAEHTDFIEADDLEVLDDGAVLGAGGASALDRDDGTQGDDGGPDVLDEHADVLMALNELQSRRRGWLSGAIVLFVSIALFLGLGAAQWDWSFVVMLVPILLFHEFGHWVAMKGFGYRDTRIFFIPLFGAAVSGRHLNAPGWKTAIVALAGPVPGIALGGMLGVVGLFTDSEWLIDGALLTIIINGLNLLPLFPFDGGRVMHAVLFSRHPLLDVVFRGLAAMTLLAVGYASGDKILMFIAIPLLMALPTAYRVASVARDFARNDPESFVPTADHRVPWPAARKIIARLKQVFPASLQPTHLAQHTLSVFETVNARPPGVLASIGILGVQAGSLIATIVLAALLVAGRHGNLFDMMQMAAQKPKLPFECGSVNQAGDFGEADAFPDATAAVIADCRDQDEAAALFRRLSANLPAGSQLTRFGQHVIVTVADENAAAHREWIRRLEEDEGLRVTVTRKNAEVTASLMAIAPSEADAERLEREGGSALIYSHQFPGLIAPWHPEWQAAGDDQRKAWLHARDTYRAAIEADQIPWNAEDPGVERMNRRMERAIRLRDEEQIADLSRQIQEIQEQRRDTAWRAFRQTADEFDQDVLAEYETLRLAQQERMKNLAEDPDPVDLEEYDPRKIDPINAAMTGLLGALPETDGRVTGPLGRARIVGYFVREGPIIHISWLTTADPATLLPDMAGWLCDENCADISYDFAEFDEFGE